MADKVEKPKKQKAKPKRDEKGVLAALPATRPQRIGGRRTAAATPSPAPKTAAATAASSSAAKASPAKANRSATAKRSATKPAAKRSAAAKQPAAKRSTRSAAAKQPAAPRATATRRKAAAPRTFEPTQAAESAAGAADERATGAMPRDAETSYPRPQAVREGAPGIGTTGYREQASSEHGRPSGVELVTTAVQAAGELAQIGLTIGGQVLKRAVNRLPKP